VCVRLYLADLHVVDDHAVGREIDELARPIVHKRGLLLLHCCFPFLCLCIREGNTVRCRLYTPSSRRKSTGAGRCARREIWGASNQRRHVGLLDNVIFCLALLWVASRGDKHMRVVGTMSHYFPVTYWVRYEAV
jgi:hypothetical protein